MRERIARELNIDVPAEAAGRSAGGRLSSALGTALKRSVVGIGVAAGATLSAALVKGWQRLTAIENATAKLEGLGHSAKTVQSILDNALASVQGTAFGLGDAASLAASAVAAGVKPGRDLERTLKLIADTATIAGTDLRDVGMIFNQVAATGSAYMGDLHQLADRGVPILQMIADELGVTASEAAKMASDGQISFDIFRNAIESNIAGAALKSGETTQGAFANMQAAMGRFGAALLEGVFPIAKQVFGGVTTFFDNATAAAKPWAEQFSGWVTNTVVPAAERLLAKVGELGDKIREFFASDTGQQLKEDTFEKLQSIFERLSTAAKDLAPAVSTIAGSLGVASGAIGISTWELLLTTVDALARVAAAVLVPAIQALAGWMERNQTAVTVLVGAYVAYRTATIGVRTVTAATSAVMGAYRAVVVGMTAASYGAAGATYAQGAALKVYNVITKATMIATKAWTAVQWALNAAMSANPIGLVVVAIAALVAGLVIAYKKSETFRNIVDKALKAVGAAAKWLWEKAIKPAWDGIVAAFQFVAKIVTWWWSNITWPVLSTAMRIVKSFAALWWWLAQKAIQPAVTAIKVYLNLAGAYFSWLWNNAIKPAVNGIATLAKWLWNNAIKPAFNGIAAAAKWLWNNGIKPAFNGISSVISGAWNKVIKPTFDRVVSIVTKVRDTFKAAFSKIGGFISSAFNGATNTVKRAINAMISLINKAVGFINNSVIAKANKIPGVDFPRIPTIPSLAEGGIVPATPGGRIVRVAEAGQAEAIIPLDKLERMTGGGPEVLELHLDLGEGIREVVRINLREHDRQLKRRVLAGVS